MKMAVKSQLNSLYLKHKILSVLIFWKNNSNIIYMFWQKTQNKCKLFHIQVILDIWDNLGLCISIIPYSNGNVIDYSGIWHAFIKWAANSLLIECHEPYFRSLAKMPFFIGVLCSLCGLDKLTQRDYPPYFSGSVILYHWTNETEIYPQTKCWTYSC